MRLFHSFFFLDLWSVHFPSVSRLTLGFLLLVLSSLFIDNIHTTVITGVGDFSIDYCVDPNRTVQSDEESRAR